MLTVYKASAGSGKTFSLTRYYITELLGYAVDGRYHLNAGPGRRPMRHRTILAITFTNAATEEMKTRIVRELGQLTTDAKMARSPYAAGLCELFGCSPADLRDAARIALAEILYDYGNFSVSTIDSFFQTVLRTFAREIDYQGDYRLSMEQEDIVHQSIGLLLDDLQDLSAKASQRFEKWVNAHTISRIRQGKSYNLLNRDSYMLSTLVESLASYLDENFNRHRAAFETYFADPHRLTVFEGELRRRLKDLTEALRESMDDMHRSLASLPEEAVHSWALKYITAIRSDDIVTDAPGKKLAAALNGDAAATSLLNKSYIEKTLRAKVESFAVEAGLVLDIIRAHESVAPSIQFYRTLLDNIGELDLLGMAVSKQTELLKDTNTMLLSESGQLLRSIISDSEVPFIYERLGMRLEHLMIDEFQDTSRLQWDNLKPLVANSVAGGHFNLIIGDVKQAIYRWRNSDSALLDHIVEHDDFPHSHRTKGMLPEENTNYRSAATIVTFNNTLFDALAHRLGVSGYENVAQRIPSKNIDKPGRVLIHFDPDVPSQERSTDVLHRMAEEIIAQHERGYDWRDILILVRRRKEGTDIVKFLLENYPQIKVLSADALLLSNSSAVRTIMSMLQMVDDVDSSENSQSNGESKRSKSAEIALITTRYHYFLGQGMAPAEALEKALDREGSDTVTPIEAIRALNPAGISALIDVIATLQVSPDERRSQYAYIAALHDMAIDHINEPDPSLSAFIAAYHRNVSKWAIKAPGRIDAVEVMTIHKSKGLERDCVHIPFGDWTINRPDTTMWIEMGRLANEPYTFPPECLPPMMRITARSADSVLRNPEVSPFAADFAAEVQREQLDNLNTLYVAYTRAGRELHIHSHTREMGCHLQQICAAMEGYDPDTATLSIGEPTHKIAESEAELSPELMADHHRDISHSRDSDDYVAVIKNTARTEQEASQRGFVNEAMRRAEQRGNELHSILSDVGTPADIDSAAEAYAVRTGAPAEKAAEYAAVLHHAFDTDPRPHRWFSPEVTVLAERSIYDAAVGRSYRPDRVVVMPDGAIEIVDYKFTTGIDADNRRQLRNYISLYHRMGYTRVRGYLWRPDQNEIEEVADAHTPGHTK